MNIFVVDSNPITAAEMLPDKLVVKMILESAQLLHQAIRRRPDWNTPLELATMKDTHINHPCARWAREDYANFSWLADHAFGLSVEYTKRYGKRHKYANNIAKIVCSLDLSKYDLPQRFALAMPDEYKDKFRHLCRNDPDYAVYSYREYMQKEKSYYATWKSPAIKPTWWIAKTKGEL